MSAVGHNTLVTGASSGLGRALAIELGRAGATVVLIARRKAELDRTATDVETAGGRALVCPMDVSKADALVDKMRELDTQLGGLDLVIANAGMDARRGAIPYEWESIRDACHVNFCGAAATLTAVLPAMVARGRGHLVGVSSLASLGALPGAAAYSSPKAALNMLLDCLHLDLRGTGVAVTSVRPGFIRTPMLDGATHPLPQLLEADVAARYIVTRLAKAPATITFPKALAFAARLGAALPRRIREPVLAKLPWY
jgi:short-subunit dehydrogenase